jgi:RND superfamily putative drug exporter
VLPAGSAARQVADALRSQFPPTPAAPAQIVVEAPASASSRLQSYAQAVAAVPNVTSVTTPRPVGNATWELDAVISGSTTSQQAQDAVAGIRSVPAAYPRYVTGATAIYADRQSTLASHLPLAVTIVVLVTLAVLFAMTGSIVLPLKAILMNALTISAAFGILVWIFQDGRFQGLLGYTGQGALDSTQPILLFATAFGLSTDYGVFLLSTIKEGRDRGLPTRDAVALGLQRTGRIVTSAALLLVVAVGAFGVSSLIFIKEYGIGTAAAIAIDAVVVRALLVPSLMALLGDWNWWAPRPLRWLHRRLGLSRLDSDATSAEERSVA